MKIIITESQYKLLLEAEFKGTKKPLGADGIEYELFKEILFLMQTTFSGETNFNTIATQISNNNKVSTKTEENTIAAALSKMSDECLRNREFNSERFPSFCYNITEILASDNDNKFSTSYGIVGKK